MFLRKDEQPFICSANFKPVLVLHMSTCFHAFADLRPNAASYFLHYYIRTAHGGGERPRHMWGVRALLGVGCAEHGLQGE